MLRPGFEPGLPAFFAYFKPERPASLTGLDYRSYIPLFWRIQFKNPNRAISLKTIINLNAALFPMRLLAFSLAALAFFFLFGCLNVQPPNCASSDYDCLYSQAVLRQDPYLCYSLPLAQRDTCFKSATDPLEKKQMQRQQAGLPSSPTPLQPAQNAAAPQPASQAQPQPTNCADSSDLDACLLFEAKSSLSLPLCAQIKGESTRQQCISNVAAASKNPSGCSIFSNENEKAICLSFSSG